MQAVWAGGLPVPEIVEQAEWSDRPVHLLTWCSGMTVAARVNKDSITLGMRLPWKHLARAPRAGERWRCNLFRCVGRDPARGYLAWQPTYTPEPSFHVPEKFGWMAFRG